MFSLRLRIHANLVCNFIPVTYIPEPLVQDVMLIRMVATITNMKNHQYYIQDQNAKERLHGSSLSLFYMKKFLVFICFLVLLIISEYLLLNEMFTQKRPFILIISLLGSLVFIFAAFRFFKKYFLTPKHMDSQS